MIQLNDIFGEQGLLAKQFKGYQARAAQVEMAQSVLDSINDKKQLVVEAGTGTGKTFAYLIPALLSGKKVIISTGTKALQDQLFFRDLPRVIKLLAIPASKALLKGRSNYLCLHRMHQIMDEGRLLDKKRLDELVTVQEWSLNTKLGDLTECIGIEESSSVIPLVTSTAENCLGGDCPLYDDCYLVKARRRAQKADIIVINHHLFFANAALKEQAENELIPDADAIIFDEAHQIPEIATQFLGERFSSRQLAMFVQDTQVAVANDAPDNTDIISLLQQLAALSAKMQQAFGQNPRNHYAAIRNNSLFHDTVARVSEQLGLVSDCCKQLAVRSKDLELCWQRSLVLCEKFGKLTGETPKDQIHWYELFQKSFSLHLTPLSIADAMRAIMTEIQCAWIFTSATLAVNKSFSLFEKELGLKDNKSLELGSPFDYQKQTLLYLPKSLPEPKSPDFIAKMITLVKPVLQASRGRAFLLFTSFRALNEAHALLAAQTDYPLFVQGTSSKSQLLQSFCDSDNGVLLGTNSFWEGVDVRGDQLSVVIIDKLPFSVPDDPVLKARMDVMRKQGGNPFNEYQLPQAVIALKQGAGRLIRDVSDRGVLMLCDPRLRTMSYGKVFIQSLPPMPITDNVAAVQAFFTQAEVEIA